MSKRRKILYALTVAVCTALWLLPMTGWLVRAQTGTAAGMRNGVLTELGVKPEQVPGLPPFWGPADRWEGARADVVRARPDDFPVQLAAALSPTDGDARIRAALALRERFPAEPAAHAALLRTAMGGGMEIGTIAVGHADEEALVTAPRPKDEAVRPAAAAPNTNHPELLETFNAAAVAGERLDPENAFFPFLHSVGLFAANQDAEAVTALKRAAEKPNWNEYVREDVESRWALSVAAQGGEIGSVSRLAQWASTLLPHYARTRACARVATAKAIQAEMRGDVAEGIAIRKAVARVGAKMRVESSSFIGSLVGQSITGIAALRPGGAPYTEKSDITEAGDGRRVQAVIDAYATYLQANGEAAEAEWYRAERAAGTEAKAVARAGMDRSLFGVPQVEPVFAAWAVGQSLLTNACLVIAFGLLYALLMRLSPALRAGERMEPSLRWAFGIALLVPATLAALASLTSADAPSVALFGVFCLAVVAGVVPPVRGRYGAKGVLRGLGVSALILALLSAGGLMMGFQVGASIWPLSVFQGLSGSDSAGAKMTFVWVAVAATLLCAAVPVLLHLGLAALARPMRLPLSFVLARGITALAGPVACLLLLGYAVATVVTVGQEGVAIRALHDSTRHEGRYQAEIVGRTWPGPVAAPR